MASLLSKKGTIKSPPWMGQKGKPGFGSQLFAIFLATVMILILIY